MSDRLAHSLAHAPGSSFVWGVRSVKETKQNTEKQTRNKRKRKKTNEERKRKEKEKEKNNESEKNKVQSKQEEKQVAVTGRRTGYRLDSESPLNRLGQKDWD